MHRWPSVTDESSGEVTLTIRSSWTWSATAQPTPQYGQIVSVDGLGRLVPGPGLAHVVLGLEHQRAGRADADAVAAVDAGRLGQRHGLLGRDPGVEAAAGDGDRERVLGVLAARLDALVAEDALRVVADVELVVDLGRLARRSPRPRRRPARGGGRPRARRARRPPRAAPAARTATDPRRTAPRTRRSSRRARRAGQRHVDRRAEELEHDLARQPDPLRIGLDLHPGLDLARAGRDEHARPGDLDDADPADVDRRQVLGVAQRRRVDALRRGRRRGSSSPAGDRDRARRRWSIRRRLDGGRSAVARACGRRQQDVGQRLDRRRRRRAYGVGRSRSHGSGRRSQRHQPGCRSADSIADDAVWPSPQIDASRIAWPISRSSASSSSRGRTREPGDEPREQLLLADAADPARDALAARFVAEELGDPAQRVDEVGRLVEDHDHARAERRADGARVASNVSGMSSASGPTKTPAAPPSRIARMARPPGHAAGELDEVAQRRPELDLVDARPRDVARQAEQLRAGRALRADRRERPSPPLERR